MDRPRKRELLALNERAWNGEADIFPLGSVLDSSLKKNTAFIKRLRTAVSSATQNTFLQEIRTLSLTKYLSEVVSACYEGLCKLKTPGEIDSAVEIVSALHQRFGPAEFTEYLGWLLGKGMATPDKSLLKTLAPEVREKEEKDRLVRQRALLRVVTELWIVGVLRTLDDVKPDDATRSLNGKNAELKIKTANATKGGGAEPFPLEVLKDLLGHDREHANLPLLVIFVKSFSWDILGVKPAGAEGRKTVEADGIAKPLDSGIDQDARSDIIDPDDSPFASPEIQERFRNILSKYFEDVKTHLVKDQKHIVAQKGRNSEAYVKSGEVFEDRQANFEKQLKAQERLASNAQVIADILNMEMPDLKEAGDGFPNTNGSIGLVKTGEYLRGQSEGAGIWEDEDERRFYENLVDLKGKVPGILLEDGKKKKTDTDEAVGKRIDSTDGADNAKFTEANDDQSTAIVNKTIGAQVDVLLTQLPDLTSKDATDQIAIQFCFLNSKASRNRLIKGLTEVPKGRTDLLPYWARLIATLGRYMPDIPKGIVDYLDAEFRSLQRRKEKDFLGQVRLSNIRYLAELTKFGIVPEHVVFHCLKVSLDDFSRMNIEIICNLLENCGRYLLRNADTSPRMTTFLETLQRKKSVQHIGQPERMLIENAIYYVDPPERASIQQKERTPIELFIRKLIYVDMTKRNYTKILKQIRRLHWEEPEVVAILAKVFTRPAKVKYGSIHILAILLSAIYRYHPSFTLRVIDNVLDAVTFGLEQNEFRYNQRRIAEIKYLGELYNYRMLEHPVIFEVMYKILTYGHGGPPAPGRLNPFDMPDDFFRIRLISTMLETCGMFFNRGAAGKKLEYFLSFLQYYIHTKHPLPMDIEFIVQDTFVLTRPQWKLATNLEEAAKALQLAIAQDQKNSGIDQNAEQDDASVRSSSDEEGMEGDGELGDPEAESEKDSEIGGDDEDGEADEDGEYPDDQHDQSQSNRGSDSEDEAIVVTKKAEEFDPEAEAEFDREFAKMMAESLESRKFDRKPMFDVPLPLRSKTTRDHSLSTDLEEQNGDGASTMAFSLLTKKGNRQQTRNVVLPSDSTFAVAMKNQQQAEREEQQRIKNLVLNYDLRESEDLDGDTLLSPLKPNPNIHRFNYSGHEKPSYHTNRSEKLNRDRGGQRIRRLQLSDVDWYARTHQNNENGYDETQHSSVADVVSERLMFDDNEAILSPPDPTMLDKRQKRTGYRRHPRNQARHLNH
ncbi:MIF4G domain-containing protein [Xylaria bambusicola]|uniref:MIF4G domain-containing protein n=1 Tax=Xylaria bambusicola TaxID=326684 RepID=UPI002007597D|nr:MIF4G domain-containing protein [Xylaria bambusicola]KAI0505549.1 MIF4G domain-containing protein [Xylaria bambusicola]